MTLLAPVFLYAALAVVAGVVALHFFVSRSPRASILPTARFVLDRPATSTSRAARPADLLLMLLRALLLVCVGLALARPVVTPARRAEARVILVDASRSVRNSAAVRDAALGIHRDGDAVVVFDSAAHLLTGRVADSLRLLAPSARTGRLSAALIAALRAASTLSASADSLELVIVSPLTSDEMDAATPGIRQLWPGRARLLRVGVGAPANDSGRPLVDWPIAARPPRAVSSARRDTIGGVVAGATIVVAPFERRWRYPRDSLRGARVVARWTDGEPAAIEWQNETACIRSVAVPYPAAGDLVLRSDFVALVSSIGRTCRRAAPLVPMSAPSVASLAGTGGRVSSRAVQPPRDSYSPLTPWLFALAIALAITELFVRAHRSESVSTTRARVAGLAA